MNFLVFLCVSFPINVVRLQLVYLNHLQGDSVCMSCMSKENVLQEPLKCYDINIDFTMNGWV